jgi:hypothetical protein
MRETLASELGGKGDVGAAMTDLVGVSERVGPGARARAGAGAGEKRVVESEESKTAEIAAGVAATAGVDADAGVECLSRKVVSCTPAS